MSGEALGHVEGRQEPGMDSDVFTPIKLPCGRTVENRLVKVFSSSKHFEDSCINRDVDLGSDV